MTVQIFKIEVSTNGRDSIMEVMDTNYIVKKKDLKLVKDVLINSFSLTYEDDIYIYFYYKNLEKEK